MKNFWNYQAKVTTCFIGSIVFLSSCLSSSQDPEYASIRAYAKKHAKQEGWQLASIGSFGFKGYSGPGFDIVYRGRDVFEIDEARDIMVRNILNFVDQHRNNAKLIGKVDLKNGQFSYRNIELRISFYIKGYEERDGAITFSSFKENCIRYWKYDQVKNGLILIHTESINDALRTSPECKDKSIIYEDSAYQSMPSVS